MDLPTGYNLLVPAYMWRTPPFKKTIIALSMSLIPKNSTLADSISISAHISSMRAVRVQTSQSYNKSTIDGKRFTGC
jgi:hypothetical protein